MAPFPEPKGDEIDLIKSAAHCEELLDCLKKNASDRKNAYRSGKKHDLLTQVISLANSNIQSLKTWIAAIRQGRQTSDQEIIRSADDLFDNVASRVADARKALDHRLRLGRLTREKTKTAYADRVREALNEIGATIGYLHNQVKTVLRDSPNQRERQNRYSQMIRTRPTSYHAFVKRIEAMSPVERQTIRLGTYKPLWDKFPPKLDLEGNVGNAEDPGDGKIYDERTLREVQQLLKAFYDAWVYATMQANNVDPIKPDPIRKVAQIAEMTKICLILRGMKQERLLDHFCDDSKNDAHLPLQPENLKNTFGDEDAIHAETFCFEQYRAIRRSWKDGEHIKAGHAEPLPLIYMHKEYGHGSYGSVRKFKHAYTQDVYACKEQINDDARAHLLREIARLRKLGHRHIVQFAKSYQRGLHYGILLKPAATTDLFKLLGRYRDNGLDYDRDAGDRRRDRVVLKPIILTAFGCLSRGLAHIHDCNIRHKDIKPHNILYEKASNTEPARFLWADFGLAHDFGNTGNSKTVSKNRGRYSPRYAAPEIMEEFEARRGKLEDIFNDDVDDDDEEEAEAPEYAPEGSYNSQGGSIGHGRSSDIYSCGIVFLEILSYLVADGPTPTIPNDLKEYMPFWKNSAGLQTWAHGHIQRLPPTDPLPSLFKLSSKMIAHTATERPVITEIVKQLAKANSQYFCTACQHESQKEPPVSMAVMAKEQMAEGLGNAKKLVASSLNHVDSRENGSVHEIEEIQQPSVSQPPVSHAPVENPLQEQIRARRRNSRTSVYAGGREPIIKRSSMRSPDRHRSRPSSVARFGVPDEIIPDVSINEIPDSIENKENWMDTIASE